MYIRITIWRFGENNLNYAFGHRSHGAGISGCTFGSELPSGQSKIGKRDQLHALCYILASRFPLTFTSETQS